jgi:hypothetical protein
MKKLILKIRDKSGSGEVQAVVIFFIGMMLLSVAFEFVRIHIISANIRDSFIRSIRTVASENYDEVYSGFKEKIFSGGYYVGGAGGGGDLNDIPEWVPMNDTADVYDELSELLDLDTENEILFSEKDNYTLFDIDILVNDSNVASSGKYEAKGSIKVKVPIHFGGVKVSNVNLTLKVTTAYSKKY